MTSIVVDAFNYTLTAASVAMHRFGEENFSEALNTILKSMLYNLQKQLDHDRCFAVWDTYGGTRFRKEIYPDYKATRDHSKTDFDAIRGSSAVYEDYDFTNVYVPECEADDAIFCLCKLLKESGDSVIVVTRDRDLLQVVQNGYADKLWDFTKKEFVEPPAYSVVDMKSLVGDGSDNIKGVPGIGKVTAMKVLTGFYKLNESQKKEFERCKDIIDATRHPRFEENLNYIRNNYINV